MMTFPFRGRIEPIGWAVPWAFLGLAAVGVPIWLHLRRRRRAALVAFSAVRFLDEAPLPRRSPLTPRDWPLLLLRLLALLAVVTAFARPYRPGERSAPPLTSRVYLLDGTLSHRAADGWNRHHAELLRRLDATPSTEQVAVIALESQPRTIADWATPREQTRAALTALTPTAGRGDYRAAFQAAQRLLDRALGEDQAIVFLGDSQANQWDEDQEAAPFLGDAKIELAAIEDPDPPSLSVSAPKARRAAVGDLSRVELAFEVYRRGPAQSAQAVLLIDGRPAGEVPIDLADDQEVFAFSTEFTAPADAWIRGEVRIEGGPDALALDNRAFFALAPVREGKALVLASSPYLVAALAPEVMRGRWSARFLADADLAAELALAEPSANVLVVESGRLADARAADLPARYLDRGRGVVLILDRVGPIAAGLLRRLGMEAAPEPLPLATPALRTVAAAHPIFRPLRAPGVADLFQVRFFRHQGLKAPAARALAIGADNAVILAQQDQALILACGLSRADTDWPRHPTFLPFLDLAMQSARAAEAMRDAWEPGEPIALALGPGPAGASTLRVGDRGGLPVRDGLARFLAPDGPGTYDVAYEGETLPRRVLSINPSPLESRLARHPGDDQIKRWRLPDAKRPPPPPVAVSAGDDPARQRLWWWLLLIGACALGAETLWLMRRDRRPA